MAFVTGAGYQLIDSTGRKGASISQRSARAVVSKSRSVTMMAEASGGGEKESLFDWLMSKVMHNYQAEYGYETFFKPAEAEREQEINRVREEADRKK